MTDLSKLSAKKLHGTIARLNVAYRASLDATIAAGMGDMRHSDIVELAKCSSLLHKAELARNYLNARKAWADAMDELDARKAFHGGDKPIKRAS